MDNKAILRYNQGYCYYNGVEGFPLNYSRAMECFLEAAELGSSEAMNSLGLMYRSGKGVPQNLAIATDWFYKALQADSGNTYAAYNLGFNYYSGSGVPKDMAKAYEFFKAVVDMEMDNPQKPIFAQSCNYAGSILLNHYNNMSDAYYYIHDAAKQGDIPEAWHNLGWLTEKGYGLPNGCTAMQRDNIALEYYKKAANKGFAQAMDAVGRLYATHNMPSEARPWLEKAAAQGYEPAKKRLKLLKVSQGGSLLNLL